MILCVSHLFFFFIVCLNFKTAKFNSIDVSVSVVSARGRPQQLFNIITGKAKGIGVIMLNCE